VVGLDSGADRYSLEGLGLTARLAGRLGLSHVLPVRGISPQDIPAVVKERLGGRIDLAFVDGYHSSDQIVAEYRALGPFLEPNAMVLFHDVQYTRLEAGFQHDNRGIRMAGHVAPRDPFWHRIPYDARRRHSHGYRGIRRRPVRPRGGQRAGRTISCRVRPVSPA